MKKIVRTIRKPQPYLWYILLALVLLVVAYFLPPVHSRLAWRVDELFTRIRYLFNPPDQAVFLQSTSETDRFGSLVATARADAWLTLTPVLTETSVSTSEATHTPTVTATPLPRSVSLSGVKYESHTF